MTTSRALEALERIKAYIEIKEATELTPSVLMREELQIIEAALSAEEIEGLDEAIEHFKYTTVVNWSDPTVSKMFGIVRFKA